MINKISFRTKIGWISAFEENGKIFKINFGRLKKNNYNLLLKKFKKKLIKFYEKKDYLKNIPHEMRGNSCQKKVWAELKKIKIGKTKTYGEIAKKFKLSPRHVGKICGQNKLLLLIPCHRVLKSDGSLGGFSSSGGVNLKKKLLDFEKNWKI